MLSADIGPEYEEVGRYLAEDVRAEPAGAFLYAEALPGTIECSIFKDMGDRIVYRYCSRELVDKLFEIWENLDKKDRWFSISYSIKGVGGGYRFEADFEFRDKVSKDEMFADRRPAIVKARFGDKPIDYTDP